MLFISVVLAFTLCGRISAQTMYPTHVGDKMRYTAMIESPKAYLSGICILYHDTDGVVKGSMFNEFGISALDFTYNVKKDKVKLHHVVKMMDKWYVRRVLRRDLRELLHGLRQGKGEYIDSKYHLTYQFVRIADEE